MHCQITLPTTFTERHRRAVEQYIQNARLTPTGWQDVLEAFDLLGQTRVQTEDETRTFAFSPLHLTSTIATAAWSLSPMKYGKRRFWHINEETSDVSERVI